MLKLYFRTDTFPVAWSLNCQCISKVAVVYYTERHRDDDIVLTLSARPSLCIQKELAVLLFITVVFTHIILIYLEDNKY